MTHVIHSRDRIADSLSQRKLSEMATLKYSVLLAAVCIFSCLARDNDLIWEIFMPAQGSSNSGFHVLHDWSDSNGAYDSSIEAELPAAKMSDVMLKTMGILREGATWSGVQLGSLFLRPRATAIFVVDGLTDTGPQLKLSSKTTYPVKQDGLSGRPDDDTLTMFSGDNVLLHFDRLFEGKSLTAAVSGDDTLARAISSSSSMKVPKAQLPSVTAQLSAASMEPSSCPVDAAFAEEVSMVKNFVNELTQRKSLLNDGAPDVFVVTFTSLTALRSKYGVDSSQYKTALAIVQQAIQEASDALVELYNGQIIVQALTLSWKYQDIPTEQKEVIHSLLTQNNVPVTEADKIIKHLPLLYLPKSATYNEGVLCYRMSSFIEIESEGGTLKASCVETAVRKLAVQMRLRREAKDGDTSGKIPDGGQPFTESKYIKGVSEQRTDNFPALFLITFVVVVPLALSLFGISWAMWNMDPGRDSVIYRTTGTGL